MMEREMTATDLACIPSGRKVLIATNRTLPEPNLDRSDLIIKRIALAKNGEPSGSRRLQAQANLVIRIDEDGRRWLLKDAFGDYVRIPG